MNDKDFLLEIFNSDSLGLIDKVSLPKKTEPKIETNLAGQKEKEVQDWIDTHGREPSEKSQDITERILAKRHKAMKKDVKTVNDANPLNSPLLDELLSKLERNNSIYDFSNSLLTKPSEKPRKTNDFVAQRTPMKNFNQYEPMFIKVQREIESKARQIVPFTATGLEVGNFYIAGGLLCYIDEIYEKVRTSFGRIDKRIHVIFANGTESNMLFASFQKIMSAENGRTVKEPQITNKEFELSNEDVQTGIIYILRSASDDETVTQFGKELYKIGYTSTTIEERIKNAANEPTYLCAPVIIMEQWKCQNLNARALETFLHRFFASEQKQIQVHNKGKTQVASEWYHVPLDVLEKTIPLIICGEIVNYRYDSLRRDLMRVK